MDALKNFKQIVEAEKNKPVRSYKIGRNELCPCGSGQKYKKCCLSRQPETKKEVYYQDIKKADQVNEIYELLRKADQDYPLEPAFFMPLIVFSLQQGDFKAASRFLKKAWRVMGTELDESFIMPLTSLLLEEGKVEEAEEIASLALEDKGSSIKLLLAYGEVKKQQEDYQAVSETIDRAMKIDSQDLQLILFRIETLLDIDDLLGSMQLWDKHFTRLQQLEDMRAISFLNQFIKGKFLLEKEVENEDIKDCLQKAIQIFAKFAELDQLSVKDCSENRKELFNKLKEITPEKTLLALDLLGRYLAARLYNQLFDYAEKIFDYHEDRQLYHSILFKAYLETDQYQKVKEEIINILDLTEAGQEFNQWQVLKDYLELLLENDDISEFWELIPRLSNIIEEDDNLLNTIMLLLENSNSAGDNQEKILKILKVMGDNDYISEHEVDISSLFLKLAQLEGEETANGLAGTEVINRIQVELAEIKEKNYESPVEGYVKLKINKYIDNPRPVEKLVATVRKGQVTTHLEAIAYYETMLRFGEPEQIFDKLPYEEYLEDHYLKFYQLVAAMKLEKYEIAISLFHSLAIEQMQNNQLESFLYRLRRYFSDEDMLARLDKMEVSPQLVEYVHRILQYE